MIFNKDIFDIIAEIRLGLTIPIELTDTMLYRYFSDPRSIEYSGDLVTTDSFIARALKDRIFMDLACSSKELAGWLISNSYNYYHIGSLTRLALVIDDRERLLCLLNPNSAFYDIDAIYAFASIDQLQFFYYIYPDYLKLTTKHIWSHIGRLDVMKFLYERNPAVFETAKDCVTFTLQYWNKYDKRSLETLEWLIATLLSEC